jgi:hypothetical protein
VTVGTLYQFADAVMILTVLSCSSTAETFRGDMEGFYAVPFYVRVLLVFRKPCYYKY